MAAWRGIERAEVHRTRLSTAKLFLFLCGAAQPAHAVHYETNRRGTQDHTKKIIFHPKMLPERVILDPTLTVGPSGVSLCASAHS